METIMTWFVVLAGAHWREVSPEVFHEHGRVKEWSQLVCQGFDASGSMIEIQKDDSTIYIEHGAVIAAVNLKEKETAMGFVSTGPQED
jgi:hypothetical protein